MERNREENFNRLYERLSSRLERRVEFAVNAPREVILDACANAWMTLARRDDIDFDSPTVGAWLFEVAKTEGWKLAAKERAGRVVDVAETVEADDAPRAAAHAEALELMAAIAELPEPQREVMRLQMAGYSYKEIAARLGKTYTWVNRHISEARQALRKLLGEDA